MVKSEDGVIPFFAIPKLRDFWEIGTLGMMLIVFNAIRHFSWAWVPIYVLCAVLWIGGILHKAQKKKMEERRKLNSERLVRELREYRELSQVPVELLQEVQDELEGQQEKLTVRL